MIKTKPWRLLAVSLLLISSGILVPSGWAGSHSAVSARATVDTRGLVSPPSNVEATKTLTDKIRVTWTGVGASGYQVYRSTGNNSGGLLAPLADNITTTYYDDYLAVAGVSYNYWVKAIDTSGRSSAFSSPPKQGFKSVLSIPSKPIEVVASQGIYEDKVLVEWPAVPQATKYEVWRNNENRKLDYDKVDDTDFRMEILTPNLTLSQINYEDKSVLAKARYAYFVRAVNAKGMSLLSKGAVGYSSGRHNPTINWDTDRTQAYYEDYKPIRAVRVVDTSNKRIQTGKQFVVRVYLCTESYQDREVSNVVARLFIDGKYVGQGEGTVFPRSIFTDWRSWENMTLTYDVPGVGIMPINEIMSRGLDTINIFVPAEKCPEAGNRLIKVEIFTNGAAEAVLSESTDVEFNESARGLTIIRVPVIVCSKIFQSGEDYGPSINIRNDNNILKSFIEVVYPYKNVHCSTVLLPLFSILSEIYYPALAHEVEKTARTQQKSVILEAQQRGDHILFCGLLPSEFFDLLGLKGVSWAGLYGGGEVILCRAGEDMINELPFIAAHELGHVHWFDLGENYGPSDDNWNIPKLSDYNKKAASFDRYYDDGNLILPSMGAINLDFTGVSSFPLAAPILSAWGNDYKGMQRLSFSPYIYTALMGSRGSLSWAEQNEYKRFCDVLMTTENIRKMDAVNIPKESQEYTGTVSVIRLYMTTNADWQIEPIDTLDGCPPSSSDTNGIYRIVSEDRYGNVTSQLWTSPIISSKGPSIAVRIPFIADVQTVRMLDAQGHELAVRHRSSASPVVHSISCIETNGVVNIDWTTTDADDDVLWHCLYYSSGDNTYYGPLVNMFTNCQITLPFGTVPGSTGGIWKIVVSDGFNTGEGVSSSYSLSNCPPTCSFAPEFAAAIELNIPAEYRCFASDLEDGDIPPSQIIWLLDGATIATGYYASVHSAIEGWHELRIEVMDSDSRLGSTAKSVFVFDPLNTPVAHAGSDDYAVPGQTVQLDGSASSDPNTNALFYGWQQVSGTNIILSATNTVNPTFVMPDIVQNESLTFELTVSNGSRTGRPDRVTITYVPSSVVVSPELVTFPVAGGATSIIVTASSSRTPWAVDNTNDWVAVVSSGYGIGNGTVTLSVGTNTTMNARQAILSVGDQLLEVQQDYDSDGDGMPDSWEERYGLAPQNPDDAVLDPDGDSLSNLAEYQAGTDPTQADTDGDSLPDGWEIKYGFNPNDEREGLHSLDGAVATGGTAMGLCLLSNRVYVADGTNGLVIVDVDAPTNPVVLGTLATAGMAYDVAVEGDQACLALGTNGVALVNVGTPTNPPTLGTCEIIGAAWGVQLVNGRAYVAAGEGGLAILDAASAEGFTNNPAVYSAVGNAMDVFVLSNRAYVAAGTNGLVIIDVNDATNPVILGQCPMPDMALGVCVASNLVFVASWGSGLQVVDVQDAGNPEFVGSCDTLGYAKRVCLEGHLAFVADGGSGVEVIDVACATNPLPRGACSTAAWVQDVAAGGGIVYAAASEAGLQIFRIAGLDENQNGISDDWERSVQGLMPTEDIDTDGDGISDWGEYLGGLNATNTDQDVDGMPDGWEVRNLLDPRQNDADIDSDGDGFSSRSEFIAGTDPNNGYSYLGMTDANPRPDGQGVVIHWSSVAGKFYLLDRSTNLTDTPPFMAIDTNVTGQAGTTSYADTNAVGPGPFFYRVIVK